MAFRSLLSLYEPRQLVVVVAVVVVIRATIGEASDAGSRRLHRWEHDLQPKRGDCGQSGQSGQFRTRRDKFELLSKSPDSNVQLYIRCNLPVSYDRGT